MPIARYQTADGKIARFEVPEGTTPEQAQKIGDDYFSKSVPVEQPAPAAPAEDPRAKFVEGRGFGDIPGIEILNPRGASAKTVRDIQKTMLTTAGATVGTMFAPEVTVHAYLGRLAPYLSGAANIITKSTGAGIGGAAGTAASGGTPQEMLDTAKEQGKEQGALQGAFGVAGAVLKPVAKALSPVLKPGAEKALKFVKSLNLPAPPSMFLQQSKLARTLENSTRATLAGSMTMDHYSGKLLEGIAQYSENVVKSIAEPMGNDYVAPILRTSIQDGMKAAAEKAKVLFDTDQIALLAKANINGNALRGAMQSELGGLSDSVMKNIANKLNVIPETNNAAQLNTFRKYLTEVKVGQADKDIVMRMKAKLDGMLGSDVNEGLNKIAASWGEIKNLKRNQTLSRILKISKPIDELLSSANEKTLDLLLKAKIFDEPTWNLIRAQNLQNIFEKYRGDQLLKAIKGNPVFRKIYDGKTLEALENYGKLTKLIDGSSIKQQLSSTIASNLGKGGLNVGFGQFVASPTAAALSNAGAAGLAWDFMRPDGVVKNLLTQGLNPTQKALTDMAIQSAKTSARAAVADGE